MQLKLTLLEDDTSDDDESTDGCDSRKNSGNDNSRDHKFVYEGVPVKFVKENGEYVRQYSDYPTSAGNEIEESYTIDMDEPVTVYWKLTGSTKKSDMNIKEQVLYLFQQETVIMYSQRM
ncbi:MAG: hypothetical protein R2741_14075 [Methanolobus sp.]